MARRHPQPFWRTAKSCWYVQFGKRQVRLSPDRDEAFRLYHELAARPPESPRSLPTAPVVVSILDAFLDWCQRSRARPTYDGYRHYLQLLASSIPRELPVSDLRPFHLSAVIAAHTWSPNSQHDFISACQRALNWAVNEGLIDRSPIARTKKPAREARELVVTPDDYSRILEATKDQAFRDLITLAWETGARVQELRRIEARWVEPERVVFPVSESKGKRRHRVIYLTEAAVAIVSRLCQVNPTGPILRNAAGRPWTRFAINNAFERLAVRIGRKFHLGAMRKGYATEALKAGVDTVTLAHLLGHADAAMVSRVYGHVQQDPEHMADAARRAKGKREG